MISKEVKKMYPLKFKAIYFEKIWGGRALKSMKEALPEGNIGESWELACHKNGMSLVANGPLAGKGLDALIEIYGEGLLGTAIDDSVFPLLIKLIHAKEALSVQVHPDDDYASIHEGELGKTEAWYVIQADPGAKLIVGTKPGLSKVAFKTAIENGELETYLNELPVQAGDVVFVKSGLLHAIGAGIVLAEVQQNSDTTYRVYDYNRGRDLHVAQALDVVKFDLQGTKRSGLKVQREGYHKTYYCLCKDFSLEIYDIQQVLAEVSDVERFYVFTCVAGEGLLSYNDGSVMVKAGETIMIPATLGSYKFEGKMKLIKSYVPDLVAVEAEILKVITE